ncbi:MAG: signal peptidase II [Gammaproteobacteria bacterium]
MRGWLWLSVVVIVLDQISKIAADSLLELYQPVPVFPGFNLMLAYNEGAAFSFLADAGGWQRWFFTILAVVMVAILLRWLKQLPKEAPWSAAAITLIIGGAIGNVVDRATMGYVVDFIDVYYDRYHWPAFNIADSAITAGVVILIFLMLTGREQATPEDKG